MTRSDTLYLLIIACFAGGYIGGLLSHGALLMYILLGAGVLLFLIRIVRGDD